MKVAIVGSRKYDNKLKIKEFIFQCKEQFGDKLEIVSGGCKYGADKFAKQVSMELDLRYVEFPPAHFPHNLYCGLPESRYGREYSVKNYHVRNKIIAGTVSNEDGYFNIVLRGGDTTYRVFH